MNFWGPGETIAASIFAPGVAVAQVLTTLNKLGCWLAKQSNVTSMALSGLLLDIDSVRHATLQNRAAVDFLLLAQGRGCEDFEGMCYMNLSDHSESIYKTIQMLKEGVKKLQVDDGWSWLNNLFNGWGLSGWVLSLIKTGGLIVVVVVLLMLPCLMSLMQRALQKAIQAIFVAQIQKGGIVGDLSWTEAPGQDDFDLEKIPVYP